MKEKIIGIYKITNKINGKGYIGQSNNIKNRESEHLWALRKNKHRNKYLQNEFNLFGEQNFKINVIFLCHVEDLNKCEKIWIKLLDSRNNEKGYNIADGGISGCRGYKHTAENKEKIRRALTGRHHSEEAKARMSKAQMGHKCSLRGCKLSEKIRANMSKALLGNKRRLGYKATEETKAKMRAARLGRKRKPFSEETKAKMRAKHISVETRAKISKANIGNKNRLGCKCSEETKAKIGMLKIGNKYSLGRKHSDEEKMKMKLAWIKRKQNKEGNNSNETKN